ncbi:MAG TPA: MraY family glycosyltransferase [Ferruginibacter sp.]|nr:MraY family glycosyltransferase [Ferruginibacter sp.]
MENILLSGALAFIITFFAIPIIIQVARQKKLFDEPDERKVHKVVIPTLGGLGIFAGFILAMLLGVPKGTTNNELQYFAAAAIVIFFVGIKDDILVLTASKKFLGQLIAACIIIKFGGVHLANMHGFLGLHAIPRIASGILTLFTVLVIINSFNLIDGIDGLAGSLGLLTTLTFGTYFFYAGHIMYSIIAFSMAGSLIGFLVYNFSPAKIFMGDTGSLLIGLVNAILVIKFINIAGDSRDTIFFPSAPAIGFAILIIPLFDTLRVFSLRLLAKRSPFSADRLHIHHFLLDLGLTHRTITLSCVGANMAFIAMAFFMRDMGTTTVIAALMGTAFVSTLIIYYSRPKNKFVSNNNKNIPTPAVVKTAKILTLVTERAESK